MAAVLEQPWRRQSASGGGGVDEQEPCMPLPSWTSVLLHRHGLSPQRASPRVQAAQPQDAAQQGVWEVVNGGRHGSNRVQMARACG